jgi:hypothetical protein
VSGVQFSPCPPFLFGSYIVPAYSPGSRSGSNGVSCLRGPSTPTRKSLDRVPLMGRAQMRVSLRHHQRLVPKDLLDRVEVHAAHNHATRRSVPEVVEPEVGDLGVLHRLCPRPAEVVEELPSRRGEHHAAKDLPCFAKSLERLDNDAVHRHPTPLTRFALRHPERAGVEVHVLPFEVGELSPPHPRVQGDDREGMKVVWQRGEQSVLLRVRQHTNPLVVLLQKLHPPDGVAVGLRRVGSHCSIEGGLQEGQVPVHTGC